MAFDLNPLLAEIERDKTITDGVVTFLEGLPSGTTVADAVALLKSNNDRTEAALTANVPPATPA